MNTPTITMRSKKFIVYRMDIISRDIYPVDKLIRLVKVDNSYRLDKDNSLKGRGVYIYVSKDNLDKVLTSKRFLSLIKDSSKDEIIKGIKEIVDK